MELDINLDELDAGLEFSEEESSHRFSHVVNNLLAQTPMHFEATEEPVPARTRKHA